MRRLLLTLLFVATSAMAQDAPAGSDDTSGQPHDFSRPTLLKITREFDIENWPQSPYDTGFVYQRGNTKFRWVPFVMPFLVNNGGDVSLNPYVDAFALNNVSFPTTAGTGSDWLSNWRTNRFLRKNIAAAQRSAKP